MRKAKPRDLLALTEEQLRAKPLTPTEQATVLMLLQAAARYVELTELMFKSQATELERLRKFEFDHTDHDYARGC